jgi:hypothetical protein
MEQSSTLFLVNSDQPGISLTDGELTELGTAYNRVLGLRAIEEKWGYLTENFLEFEGEIARRLVEATLGCRQYDGDHHPELGRRLSNFLSTCRMYIEQIPQNLGVMSSSFDNKLFKMETSRCYDASVAYQLLDAMRNHAQHGDFPFDTLIISSKGFHHGTVKHHVVSTVQLTLDLEKLRQTDMKKKSLERAIEEYGNNVDLLPTAREYYGSLCSIHGAVRSAVEPEVVGALAIVNAAIARATQEIFGAADEGWAVAFGAPEQRKMLIDATGADQRRGVLRQRYNGSPNAHRRFYRSDRV